MFNIYSVAFFGHRYIDNPKETSAFFFSDENGKIWGRSGDLGYVAKDGLFTLTSRKKQMIVRPDGHNVFPSEIENVISTSSYVKEYVVIGIKDPRSVTGEYPAAFIELNQDIPVSEDYARKTIISKVKAEIPVRDRPVDEGGYIFTKIPYTSEGKIDRTKLAQIGQSV